MNEPVKRIEGINFTQHLKMVNILCDYLATMPASDQKNVSVRSSLIDYINTILVCGNSIEYSLVLPNDEVPVTECYKLTVAQRNNLKYLIRRYNY